MNDTPPLSDDKPPFPATSPSPFWPTFADKLLIALIHANLGEPGPDIAASPSERLNDRYSNAREAIFGIVASPGASGKYDLPDVYNAFCNPAQGGILNVDWP
jgi:hypothetical protein